MLRSSGLRAAIEGDLVEEKKKLVAVRDKVQKVVDKAEVGTSPTWGSTWVVSRVLIELKSNSLRGGGSLLRKV